MQWQRNVNISVSNVYMYYGLGQVKSTQLSLCKNFVRRRIIQKFTLVFWT